MDLTRKSFQARDQFAIQLNQLSEYFQELNQTYKNPNQLPLEIQKAMQILTNCNETLQNKKVTVDANMMQKLFIALAHLKVLNLNLDVSAQAKINALRSGLFTLYVLQLEKFEKNLKKWRIGLRVAKSHEGNSTDPDKDKDKESR